MFELLRAVLDTNVLISAFLSDRGVPAVVLEAARQGAFSFVTSEELLDELERNLVRKLDVPAALARRKRQRITRGVGIVTLRTKVTIFPSDTAIIS